MPLLKNERLILQPLTTSDAKAYHQLYAQEFGAETAEDFTNRIIALCNYVWTIRLKEQLEVIIGDCALHHYNDSERSVEIGGSLSTDFQQKGIMKQALEMVIAFAREHLFVNTVFGKTRPGNFAAIKLVSRMGFIVVQQNADEVLLAKTTEPAEYITTGSVL